jgi:[amino group carrier protein]-L-2-aminoadipate 6-kinase
VTGVFVDARGEARCDVDSVLVVKCGGHGAVDSESVCRDVARLVRAGRPVVLVHGGSHQIERLAARLGVPQRTQLAPDGVRVRYTDEASLEVVTLALAGLVKPTLVAALSRHGVRAVGLTGLDGGLLRARRKAPQRAVVDGRQMLVRDNRSGTVYRVDTELLGLLTSRGMVPVVSPPALADSEPVNVNADRVAAAVAVGLGARLLVFLTGAPGVQQDPSDERTVLDTFTLPPPGTAMGGVSGGMGLKLVAAREALAGGVHEVRIADGRGAAPVRAALDGAGTRVVLELASGVAGTSS